MYGTSPQGTQALQITQRAIIARMPAADDANANVVRQLMDGRNIEENFRKLFQTYCSPVSAFFSRNGFSIEDCQDLTQEVFLAVYKGLDGLRSEAAFVGWLFSIARHIGFHHLDRQGKSPRAIPVHAEDASGEELDIVGSIPASGPDPLGMVLQQERVDVIREALQGLPARVQDCLRARLVDGLKYSEIGEQLGISENTVAVHVHRGLKNLKTNLKRFFGGAPSIGEL
jgi:RNA polymerase sigma-70 factor (ECF subfamily)